MQRSPAKVPKKRGRPPLTKEYANPLESPMAHSSMKVQKQGTLSFSKPLMKVGQLTPKSKKRRQSSAGQHHQSESNNISPLKDGPGGLSPPASILSSNIGTTKKGRYRGVILSTPVKASPSSMSESSTPDHKRFSPSSLQTKKTDGHIPLTPKTVPSKPQNGHSGHKNDKLQNFALSLNINSSGKATIGASPSDLKNPNDTKDSSSPTKGNMETSNFQKKDVLFLLRKMKNGTANRPKIRVPKKEESISPTFVEPKLPPIITSASSAADTKPMRLERAFTSDRQTELKHPVPCTPPAPSPMSPSNFFDFQMRTGLTPNINGSLGVLSPFRMTLGTTSVLPVAHPVWDPRQLEDAEGTKPTHHTIEKAPDHPVKNESVPGSSKIPNNDPYKQVVFKYSVGDPLLLNDEQMLGDNAWQENINARPGGMSPGRGKVFNTPPSFLNFGSPGSLLFSPPTQRRNSSILVAPNTEGADHVINHINILRNHQRILNTTGKIQDNVLKSPKFRLPNGSVKESLGNELYGTGERANHNNRLRQYDRTEANSENYNNLSPGFESNKENPSPLMSHAAHSTNRGAQGTVNHESNSTPKVLTDGTPETPGGHTISQGKTDDAMLALRSLIKDKATKSD